MGVDGDFAVVRDPHQVIVTVLGIAFLEGQKVGIEAGPQRVAVAAGDLMAGFGDCHDLNSAPDFREAPVTGRGNDKISGRAISECGSGKDSV